MTKKYKIPNGPVSDLGFRFWVSRFVSNFDIRISDFISVRLGATNFFEVILLGVER